MKRTSFDIADEYLPATVNRAATPTSDSTPGVMAADVLRVFAGGRILDLDELEDCTDEKPKAICIRCRGPIVQRVWPDHIDFGCQACGRAKSDEIPEPAAEPVNEDPELSFEPEE